MQVLQEVNTNSRIFRIKTAYINLAQDFINKLGKKCTKVRVKSPILTVVQEKLVKRYPDELSVREPWFESYTELTLEWEDIKLPGGWLFVATAEAYEQGNIITGVATLSDRLPNSLRTSKLTCDHCRVKRNRKKHIILINDEDQVKIVGSTCIKDFLGHDAESQIAILEMEGLFMASAEDDDFWGGGGAIELEASLKTVITMAFTVVRTHGWVKSSDSDLMQAKASTHSLVTNQLWNSKLKPEDRIHAIDEDLANAEKVLKAWSAIALTATPASSEWDWKKALIISRPCVEPKKIGLVVGMAYGQFMAQQRELERQELAKNALPSNYFGEEGKRGKFEVTILKTLVMPDYSWGESKEMVTGVQTGTANKFVWFNTGDRSWYKLGDTCQVKATVKAQNEHEKYGKQTQIARVTQA